MGLYPQRLVRLRESKPNVHGAKLVGPGGASSLERNGTRILRNVCLHNLVSFNVVGNGHPLERGFSRRGRGSNIKFRFFIRKIFEALNLDAHLVNLVELLVEQQGGLLKSGFPVLLSAF